MKSFFSALILVSAIVFLFSSNLVFAQQTSPLPEASAAFGSTSPPAGNSEPEPMVTVAATPAEQPGMLEAYTLFLKIVSHPLVAKLIRIISDVHVVNLAKQCAERFNFKVFLALEGVLLLALAIYRAFKTKYMVDWFARLWFTLWTTTVYAALALIAIPVALMGRPFWDLLVTLVRLYQTVGLPH